MRGVLVLVALALTLACAPQAAESTVVDPNTLSLPESQSAAPAIDDLPLVIVSKTKLMLASTPHALDLPLGLRAGDDPLIEPLRAWLGEIQHGPGLAVAIDRDASSELAMEVLATCMSAGFSTFHIAVTRDGETAQIPLAMGRPEPPSKKPLAVSLFREGIIVKVPEGNVAPGCQGLGEGVTLSRTEASLDRETLGACLARMHDEHHTNVANLLVRRDTPFHEVIAVLDALRRDAKTDQIGLGIAP